MTFLPIQQQLIAAFRDADDASRPDFIGLGFAKAGTTWLFEMLKEHPDIYMATKQSGGRAAKEFNIWSGYDNDVDVESYLDAFRAGAGKIRGEFSTTYTTPLCIRAIHEGLPNTRLVCGIRNPVTMLYSAFVHERRSGARYDNYQDYHDRIVVPLGELRWLDATLDALDALPPDLVHIYLYEDLAGDPAATVQEIYRFLSVDPGFQPMAMTQRYNVGYGYRSRRLHLLLMEILVGLFGRARGKQMVSTPHLRPFWADFLMRLNEKAVDDSTIPEETRRFLIEQTRNTCHRTLDRFNKWRDWGYDLDA